MTETLALLTSRIVGNQEPVVNGQVEFVACGFRLNRSDGPVK